jgi:hypothetical protein
MLSGISLSDGNNIRSNRGSSEWELIIVNRVDNSPSSTPARASDRRVTTRKGFWYERARVSLSDESRDGSRSGKEKRKMRRRRAKVPDKSSSQDAG